MLDLQPRQPREEPWREQAAPARLASRRRPDRRRAHRRDDVLAGVGGRRARRTARTTPSQRVVQLTDRPRQIVPRPARPRCRLRTTEGTRKDGMTIYSRRYPTARPRRRRRSATRPRRLAGGSRAVAERLPDRREHEPQQRAQADSSTGSAARPSSGDDVILTLRPVGAALALDQLAGRCGAVVAMNIEDRRGARDGVVADVQPEPHRCSRAATAKVLKIKRRAAAARRRSSTARRRGSIRRARRSRWSPPRPRSTRASSRRARAFYDPGYCTEYGKRGLERGQPGPGRARGLRQRHPRPGLRALDQLRLLQRRQGASDAKTILDYAKRFGFYSPPPLETPADERAPSGLYTRTEGSSTRRPRHSVDPGRLAFGQERMLATPLQMAMVAATIANKRRRAAAVPRPSDRRARRLARHATRSRAIARPRRSSRRPPPS